MASLTCETYTTARKKARGLMLASFIPCYPQIGTSQSFAGILAGKASITDGLGQLKVHRPCCQTHFQDISKAQTILSQDGRLIMSASRCAGIFRYTCLATDTPVQAASPVWSRFQVLLADTLYLQQMADRWAEGALHMTKLSAQYSSGSTWI